MSVSGILNCRPRQKGDDKPLLVQEGPGFHLGIAPEIITTGRHAAHFARARYGDWLDGDRSRFDSQFKRDYFTIAVGGGNTVKFEYRALLKYHAYDINWLEHVRFFFLEESCNEKNRESSRDGLVSTFLAPLANALITRHGTLEITQKLGLGPRSSNDEIVRRLEQVMIFPIDMGGVEAAIARGDRELALQRAKQEARRYQGVIRERLGPAMSFHMIVSGIGKDGGIGAFATYTPELKQKEQAAIALEKNNGAISVALNRGVLTSAERISLIISGSLKLKALGRFEMEESADFEQTVMETPIRMLRETREIAEKVYIFADDRALHFEEGTFQFNENGETVEVKSEVREGEEQGGVHILLVHGFMGLYSYINLLIRLPSAWKVSALRRGKYAKQLSDEEVFPHYANALREIILQNWRDRRPTPICCHSMAGSISDHLLLSVLEDYHDELPEFAQLEAEDRKLIEALRAGGIVHIATWAPSDTRHLSRNFAVLNAHKRRNEALDYSGPASVYDLTPDGDLVLDSEHGDGLLSIPTALQKLINFRGTERVMNALNVAVRSLFGKVDLQKRMKQQETPYGQRLLASRVVKKVSFYGVLKEVNAAMHDPYEYQDRHLKALHAIVKYDIPLLVVIHRDDFMVSANRHIQEHEFLLSARMEKEGVRHEQDLEVPVRLVLLERDTEELSADPINPHFLILSTTHEGGGNNARKVTAAITGFVNEVVARAISAGKIKPLASVAKWRQEHELHVRKKASRKKARAAAAA
jgi:6-phosphogluconolactonase/glucosamine-6-phosphate isomerase/deaminase